MYLHRLQWLRPLKRQIRAAYGYMAPGQSPWAQAELLPRLNVSSVCDAQRRWGGVCGLRCYTSEPCPYLNLLEWYLL